MQNHLKQCHCPEGFTGDSAKECVRVPVACDVDCAPGYTCRDSMCLPVCHNDLECASNEKCLKGNCMRKLSAHISSFIREGKSKKRQNLWKNKKNVYFHYNFPKIFYR